MKILAWLSMAAAAAILGCSIGAKYTVGGTLTGLTGQGLVLEDNSGNDLKPASNGAFAFSDGVANGDAYSVTVKTQPSNPSQTCTVHNGSAPSTRPMSPMSSSLAPSPDASPTLPTSCRTTSPPMP